jgi:extracellular factor (EF) 3-hydroxypalmitic acid methyl ester biosynthesis protein
MADNGGSTITRVASTAAVASSGPVGFAVVQVHAWRNYEDLEGGQGREVFFRPIRFRPADLAPVIASVAITTEGVTTNCALHDVSQTGVAFEWHDANQLVKFDVLALSFDGYEAYRGGCRIVSVRAVDGVTIVAATFLDFLINIDHVLQLRTVRQWRHAPEERMTASRLSWHVGGHDGFKAKVAEFRLFMEEAKHQFGELERALPWNVVNGERNAPGHQGLVERVREDFVPDVVQFAAEIDALRRLASPQEDHALKAFSRLHVHEYMMQSPWMARALAKPLGYPGDYEVMNYVYSRQFEGPNLFGRAVSYAFLQAPASIAVRARKDMVRDRLRKLVLGWKEHRPIRILSVAAGPAQEVFELLTGLDDTPAPIEIILFDQDHAALAYGYGRLIEEIAARWAGRVRVTFLHDSIRRLLQDPEIFRSFGSFDAIICAGLYDYLRVPTAVALTRNMFARLNEGGEAYIGNMAVENPSRWFMEQHLDWVLIHRTRDEMRAFAEEAAPTATVSILEEISGVNPFLCVRRS